MPVQSRMKSFRTKIRSRLLEEWAIHNGCMTQLVKSDKPLAGSVNTKSPRRKEVPPEPDRAGNRFCGELILRGTYPDFRRIRVDHVHSSGG